MSRPPISPSLRRVSYAPSPPMQQYLTPLIESVDLAIKNTQLPENLTKDDFTRAVAVATVSALRHQQGRSVSPVRIRAHVAGDADTGVSGHGGHEAPEWSRMTSAAVLLACTALYAVIAGMSYINDVVVTITNQTFRASGRCCGLCVGWLRHRREIPRYHPFRSSPEYYGIHECHLIRFKREHCIEVCVNQCSRYCLLMAHQLQHGNWFCVRASSVSPSNPCYGGVFCLVCSRSNGGNCLLVHVSFSSPCSNMDHHNSCASLILPRWDAVVIILAVFLMTYTYIEAKSNYHRGSILILR